VRLKHAVPAARQVAPVQLDQTGVIIHHEQRHFFRCRQADLCLPCADGLRHLHFTAQAGHQLAAHLQPDLAGLAALTGPAGLYPQPCIRITVAFDHHGSR